MRTLQSFLFLMLLGTLGLAQESVSDKPRLKYEAKLGELQSKFVDEVREAHAQTLAKLDEIIKAESAKGDLDDVLAAKAEKARLENYQPVPKGNTPYVIQPVRAFYEGKLSTARIAYDRAARAAHAILLAELDLLVKDETKAGRLESAIAARDYRKSVEKSFPTVPPMPGPVKPKDPVAVATPMPMPKYPPKVVPKEPVVVKPPVVVPPPMSTTSVPVPAGSVSFTWENAIANPAQIKIVDVSSVPLDSKSMIDNTGIPAFQQIPKQFDQKSIIYSKPKSKYNGVAEITVEADGFLFLACNYSYQGNSGGGWEKERWLAKDFVKNGWKQLTEAEVGGILMKKKPGESGPGVRPFEIFVKYVKKGEEMRLRCNKYEPPYPILFTK